jgi:hypothetical protein
VSGEADRVTARGRPEYNEERGAVIPFYAGLGIKCYATSARNHPIGIDQGIADVVCFWERLRFSFFHETKVPPRRQSLYQFQFEANCIATVTPYVLGGLEEALAFAEWMGVGQIVGPTMRVKPREKWPNPAEVQDLIESWPSAVARHDAVDKFGYQEARV